MLTTMPVDAEPQVTLLAALHSLRDAATTNLERTTEILLRLDHIESRLAAGDRVTDTVTAETAPPVAELLTQNMAALETSGADFRAAQARSLHAEGVTMEVIAELFGVTRQRISAILR